MSKMMIETSALYLTPDLLRSALLDYGSLLIRDAIEPNVIAPLALEVDRMLAHYDEIPPEVLKREMENDCEERKDLWRQILCDGVHYNYDLVTFSQGRHSLFDPIRKSVLASILKLTWPTISIVENHITNVRRIAPKRDFRYSDEPLHAHVDAMFHQSDNLGINFWTPLTEAGGDAPGLAVLPLGPAEALNYLEYNPAGHDPLPGDFANMGRFAHRKLTPERLAEANLDRLWQRPVMQPGDVLAFTNFTIHSTSVLAGMTKPRTSIEARVLLQ